jgi:2TM domain
MGVSKLTEFGDQSLRKIAKEMILRKFLVILHALIYVFINIALFIINYLTDFTYPWFLWPLAAWGLLVGTHGFYYFTYRRGIVNVATLGFIYHLWGFFSINIFIVFVDFMSSIPIWSFSPWYWWVLSLWGCLLLIHVVIYCYLRPRRGESPASSWIDRKIDQELARLKQKQDLNASSKQKET